MDKAPGEIVAAKFTPDGKWYRARVLFVEESRMKVCMIKYFTDHSVCPKQMIFRQHWCYFTISLPLTL